MLPLLTVLLPLCLGAALGLLPTIQKRTALYAATLCGSALTLCLTVLSAVTGGEVSLGPLVSGIPFLLRVDGAAKIFTVFATLLYLPAIVYAYSYLKEDVREQRFHAFLLLSLAALLGVGYAGNMVTLYLFFEALTLLSLPLVLHNRTKEALSAGKKYLFYSVGGAFLALPAVCAVCLYAQSEGGFAMGGILDPEKLAGNGILMTVLSFLAILGFGAKAGLVPLHAWLTAAHPASPAPASALLSGVIAKAGIFAVLRLIYYAVGIDLLSGTWVQYTLMILSMITVFMGSSLALKEPVLKKRLAYSSISNLSYILLGLSCMNAEGLSGAFLHMLAHGPAKMVLFLAVGAVMHTMGAVRVEDLRGFGRRMPVTAGCFLLSALSLVGIPPFAGFVSKWQLSLGALETPVVAYGILIPLVLVLSALLTAGYLFPPVLSGSFGGEESPPPRCEADGFMRYPMLFLCLLSLLLGIFGGVVIDFWLAPITSGLLL